MPLSLTMLAERDRLLKERSIIEHIPGSRLRGRRAIKANKYWRYVVEHSYLESLCNGILLLRHLQLLCDTVGIIRQVTQVADGCSSA